MTKTELTSRIQDLARTQRDLEIRIDCCIEDDDLLQCARAEAQELEDEIQHLTWVRDEFEMGGCIPTRN